MDEKATYSFYEDDGATLDYKDGEYNVTDLKVKRKGKHIEFKKKEKATGYDTDLESYTLKLNGEEAPTRVRAAKAKYKEVSSVEEVKSTQESFFYDNEEEALYVNVPADEKHKVKIFFNGKKD
ncbi:DUF5110 domain-containing protein [Halobacillus litoralis]|uniref:DUF5110 domain-containing protein n=1 Tax=Halobacillus litoralis TaxID=45668 RepID=UPI003531C197